MSSRSTAASKYLQLKQGLSPTSAPKPHGPHGPPARIPRQVAIAMLVPIGLSLVAWPIFTSSLLSIVPLPPIGLILGGALLAAYLACAHTCFRTRYWGLPLLAQWRMWLLLPITSLALGMTLACALNDLIPTSYEQIVVVAGTLKADVARHAHGATHGSRALARRSGGHGGAVAALALAEMAAETVDDDDSQTGLPSSGLDGSFDYYLTPGHDAYLVPDHYAPVSAFGVETRSIGLSFYQFATLTGPTNSLDGQFAVTLKHGFFGAPIIERIERIDG